MDTSDTGVAHRILGLALPRPLLGRAAQRSRLAGRVLSWTVQCLRILCYFLFLLHLMLPLPLPAVRSFWRRFHWTLPCAVLDRCCALLVSLLLSFRRLCMWLVVL